MNFDKTRFIEIVRNHSASAVPMVLIATGLMSILLLAVMEMNALSVKTNQYAFFQKEFRLVVSEISSVLKTENSCRTSLGGPPTFGGTDLSHAQHFIDPAGPGINLDNLKLYFFNNATYSVFLDPTDVNHKKLGDLTITQFSLHLINSIQSVAGGKTAYQAQLLISATNNTTPGGGGFVFYSSDIYLTVLVDVALNVVVSCSSLNFNGGTQIPLALPSCGPRQFLFATGNQLNCVPMACVSPRVSTGTFNSDGSIQCTTPH